MLYNIYKVTLVLLLCGVICENSCNNLSEKGNANVKEQLSELEERFNKRFQKLESKVEAINDAVAKMVISLVDKKPNTPEQRHGVKKREVVISSDPLTNLPLSELANLLDAVGKDGRDGKDGATGPVGPAGASGPAGAPGERGKDGVSGGAVYTRWGRTTCGSDSTLLYSGYAGGSNWNQPGGGVNYQCMPLDPQYNRFFDGSADYEVSFIAGVEYQTFNFGIFPKSPHDQNAPCARCYTNNRSALMMIPAKRDCSEGWNKEYEGYLMTDRHLYNHQNTFECVDASPEHIIGEGANNNGGLFYFIRTQCNRGGHCPPYDGKKEITCVVCSK